MATGMLIDGVFASEAVDSSGEVLSVEGCDISTLDVDGVANWEHRGDDDEDHSATDIVGKIVYAKKIFKESDCENERQRKYWREVELPYIYGIVRLYDGAGHSAAKNLAAQIRDHHANGEPILVRYSIEGSTLKTSPDKKHLLESVARKVAMTVKPCNRSCHSGIISDPNAPEGFDKNPGGSKKDPLDDVLKRSEHQHPLYTRLGGSTEIECSPMLDEADLSKTITAGNYNAAPSTLTGGAALQREDQSMVLKAWANRAKTLLRSWDGKGKFKDVLKHELPEASDEFIDRFSDMVDEHKFKKADILLGKSERPLDRESLIRKYEALAINLKKMAASLANGNADRPTPGQFEFQGRRVTAGTASSLDGKSAWALLAETPDHYIGMSVSGQGPLGLNADDLVRLPRSAEGTHYQVQAPLQAGDFVPANSLAQKQKPGLGLENVFDVYMDAGGKKQLAGRILKTGANVDVLADFFGHLAHAQGPLAQAQPALDSLQQQGFTFVSRADIQSGMHPDLIREQEFPSAASYSSSANGDVEEPVLQWPRPLRPSEFEYLHPALKTPVAITVQNRVMYFNGHPLSPAERQRILTNIRSRIARIRYKKGQLASNILKQEAAFEDLVKIEPHLQTALDEIRGAVKAGHISEQALKHLTSNLFVDPMTKGIGNKKAYEDFLARPKQGVHVRLDGNDFGQINKIHSFEHGNQAIVAMGQAMREAMDEAVGRGSGKLFRIGGDEFHAHVPTMEHASKFARTLRAKLEAIPPIGGTHALSVSAGFGHDPDSADQASIHAKQAKVAARYQPGQAKTHVHSLVPGHEGAIPMDPEQLPTISPKSAGAAEAPEGPPAAPAQAAVQAPKP